MKKLFLFATAAAVLCSCSNQPKYIIDGDIAGLEGTVYLYQGDSLIDSAAVKAGKFQFRGNAGAPAVHYLLDSREGQPQAFAMQFILEPGNISIKSDAEDAQVRHTTGTPANDASDAYSVASRTLIKEYRDQATTDERREAIEKEFEQLTLTTIDNNRDNFFGVVLMPNRANELSGQELLDRIAEFSPGMQKSRELAALRTVAAQRLKTDIGQPYMNIMQGDADGQIVTLTSVIDNPANKYTLVDFWASWCGPCMEEVPHLKQAYDKFHGQGFEIYGVSLDNDNDKWLGAIREHGMGWVQVSDLNGFDNLAAKDYAVQSIPSNFLIDAQGRIVAKNLRGEDLCSKVAELLAE